jgi:hypothetical protein
MPQPRKPPSSAGQPKAAKAAKASGAAAKPRARKAGPTKPAGAKAAGSKPASAKAAGSKKASAKTGAAQRGGADDTGRSTPRIEIHVSADAKELELVAERLRKLNERIIELGREAGGGRLTSYERTLKTIATNISRGPGKDDLEWITQLAASQAKFVREITDSWAKAARDRFK